MQIKPYTLAAFLLTGALAGCSTVALQPGAEAIKVTKAVKLPGGCQRLGQVASKDVNGVTQSYQSHAHLQEDQLATLKNAALKLGANVIVLTEHQTTYVKSQPSDNPRTLSYRGINTHRIAGIAYRCEAKALNRITIRASISDVKTKDE